MNPIKVKIQNFQSVEDLEFEIDGFTTITGKTNIGKSAIVRAISGALLNTPVIGMVRKGASHVTVELSNDRYHIKWEKGEKGINRYTINGKLYDKVGGKQLPQVEDLGFGSVEVGSDIVYPWFASQFFPIFLLDKSGSQVTDFISEVSRLNVIQDAIVLSAKKKRQVQDKVSQKTDVLKEEKKKQEIFKGLENVERLRQELKDQRVSIDEYHNKIDSATKHLERIEKKANEVRALLPINKLTVPVVVINSDVKQINSAHDSLNRVRSTESKIRSLAPISAVKIPEEINEVEHFTRILKHQDITSLQTNVNRMESLNVHLPIDMLSDITSYKNMSSSASTIQKCASAVNDMPQVNIPHIEGIDSLEKMLGLFGILASNANTIRDSSMSFMEVKVEFDQVQAEIDQIPLCPTCNTPNIC